MRPYQIIADSSCDLPASLREQYGVSIVPYFATLDGTNYYKEIVELSPEEFYEKIAETKAFPKTSLPPIQDYIDVFEPHLKAGKDILCICLTSKFSGSFQSANNAKQILLENYPDRKIEILDSISATATQGLLVWEACKMQQEGLSMYELIAVLDKQKQTSKINFTVDSLDFLQRGGRIGKATALAGTILNIKPIIVMKEGELFPDGKVRGHKKALKTVLDMTLKELEGKQDDYYVCAIRAEKDRTETAKELLAAMQAEGFQVDDTPWIIGTTIGTHCGPTAVGLAYIRKHETL